MKTMQKIRMARRFMTETTGRSAATRQRIEDMLTIATERLNRQDFVSADLALNEARRSIESAYL